MPSSRYNTAQSFIDAFETLSPALVSCRTESCTHLFRPASLEMPPKNNAAFAEHVDGLHGIIEKFPVTAKEIMEDEEQNRVIIWATGIPHFYQHVMDEGPEDEWKYQGEYIFILSMDSTGEKIERIVEFLDSKATDGLRKLMARARANKARKETA